MQGKNIIVTGATSGIGEAVLNKLCAEGATVIAVGRNEEKLDELSRDRRVGACVPFAADLSVVENVRGLFDFCKQHGMKIDGVVHAAGITLNVPLRVNNVDETGKLFRLNVEALAEICRFASSKRYVNEGASIVAMSSTASFCGGKGISVYSASKAAVNTLVKTAAQELVSRGIRINAIAPAMVRTPMYYETIREIPEVEDAVSRRQPLGLIEPDSIAELVSFLMSDKARYMTGAIVVVGAGLVL